ncbi:MAG: DNA polymerase ligase N-terminal domain-containing protein [Thermotogota bacterium]
MSESEKLKDYHQKRDFEQTSEPKESSKKASGEKPIFVIQKHDASNLHYDFRLQVGDVLKSWAVPKGPSTDPSEKRLALETEDHPVDYADFEGTIPEGQYGAGVVIVWDKGTYENTSEKNDEKLSMEEAVEKGHITVTLHGKKLKGEFALIRTQGGENPKWLLMKKKDAEADARRNPVSTEPKSVLSGKTIVDLKGDDDK